MTVNVQSSPFQLAADAGGTSALAASRKRPRAASLSDIDRRGPTRLTQRDLLEGSQSSKQGRGPHAHLRAPTVSAPPPAGLSFVPPQTVIDLPPQSSGPRGGPAATEALLEPLTGPAKRFYDHDFVVKVRQEGRPRWFHVERNIVTAYSPFLLSAATHEFKEARTRTLDMSDHPVDGPIIELALRHIYGEPYTPTAETVVPMTTLLDFWRVQDGSKRKLAKVLDACGTFLSEKMDPGNVGVILRSALAFDRDDVVMRVVRFARESKPAQEAMKDWSENELVKVIDNEFFNISEDAVVELALAWGEKKRSPETDAYNLFSQVAQCIRWQWVSERNIHRCFRAGMLTTADVGEIFLTQHAYRAGEEIGDKPVFDAALKTRMDVPDVRQKKDSTGFVATVTLADFKEAVEAAADKRVQVKMSASGKEWLCSIGEKDGAHLCTRNASAKFTVKFGDTLLDSGGTRLWSDEDGRHWGWKFIASLADGTALTKDGHLPVTVDVTYAIS
jgi:hypothetical protein